MYVLNVSCLYCVDSLCRVNITQYSGYVTKITFWNDLEFPGFHKCSIRGILALGY